MSKLLKWMENEPIWKRVAPVSALTALVALLAALHLITPDQAASVVAFLGVFAGPLAIYSARTQTVGPVTASQMVLLPGTEPVVAAPVIADPVAAAVAAAVHTPVVTQIPAAPGPSADYSTSAPPTIPAAPAPSTPAPEQG